MKPMRIYIDRIPLTPEVAKCLTGYDDVITILESRGCTTATLSMDVDRQDVPPDFVTVLQRIMALPHNKYEPPVIGFN